MSGHYPVMLPEVLESLNPTSGQVYVDGTFGAGGYARAILDAADCAVIGVDRDGDAAKRAEAFSDEFGERFTFLSGCFGDVEEILSQNGFEQVDGFILDLGVSSFQIDEAARGFSFRFDGPLDMRMGSSGMSAADLVNETEEKELADIIYLYGEERHSRRVAKGVVARRKEQKFETTLDLADVVRGLVPKSKDGIDPATRTFQALRIAVNDELGELERALGAAEKILKPGGRLVVVSFHSLEDRMVKEFLRAKSGGSGGSRYLPQVEQVAPVFELISRKAIKPSDAECAENSRSRSAKLRAAIKVPRKEGG
ncbi:MAG: 16S rRNA (cytosine(1402)-N(4))-methyltransferase RsmH [Pseudomonadota bacterium]